MNRSHLLVPLVASALAADGRAQVFDYSLEGTKAETSFGAAVSRIGDVDQDGGEDFIVGAPDSGSANQGAVSVYSGKSGALLAHLTGRAHSEFGASVDGKIDADGDGFPDVLIGAPNDDTLAPFGGRVLVYSPHLDQVLLDLKSALTSANFGFSVRSLQTDYDGDGIVDFIVGEPGADTVLVLSGATGAALFIKSGQTGSTFGASVSLAGDVDNDGVVDFAVGSPYFQDKSGNRTGRVDVFSGADGSRIWAVQGESGSKFGTSLAHPGDLDGDGFGDLVVGVPERTDSTGAATGCATVLSGKTGTVLYKVFGDADGDDFGWSVRSASGDIDGDGVNDFLVGAPQFGITYQGYARLVSGASGTVLFTFTEHSDDPLHHPNYGTAVTGGDFDGDGRTDVIVGGWSFDAAHGNVEVWKTAVAGWDNYGTGWGGHFGVPYLTVLVAPVVGQPLDVYVGDSAATATSGLLLLGLAEASLPTGKGGTLLVVPLLFVPITIPTTGLTLSGAIPDDPSLYGFDLDLQALELDVAASKGWSFTRGLHLHFGFL